MGVAQRVAEGPALALGRAVAERRPLGGGRDARDGQRGERVPLGGRQTLGDAARVGERRRVARADRERRQRPAEFRERRPRVRPAQFQGPQARERLAGRLDARGGGAVREGEGGRVAHAQRLDPEDDVDHRQAQQLRLLRRLERLRVDRRAVEPVAVARPRAPRAAAALVGVRAADPADAVGDGAGRGVDDDLPLRAAAVDDVDDACGRAVGRSRRRPDAGRAPGIVSDVSATSVATTTLRARPARVGANASRCASSAICA